MSDNREMIILNGEQIDELVRCKDCKHGTETDYKDVYFCRLGNGMHHRTFYCGNAERKDEPEAEP